MDQQFPAVYEDGVIKPLEPLHLPEHQRVWVSIAADNGTTFTPTDADGESFYDAAARLGYVGCIKGTPGDLSTNKKYMEGFGKSGA
jgi:predicted DNA-binding antitoxin AbrB/MazE fold protein